MDGTIIIGTEIDKSKLEKQLAQLEKENTRLKDKKLKLDLDNTKALNNLKKVDDKLEALNDKIAEFESNNIPEVRAESTEYQQMISQREQLNAKGEEYLQQLDMIKIKQNEINQSLNANSTSIDVINSRLNNMPLNLEGINSKLKKVTTSVAKWGLALFGIRTAYSFIRQMISQATQQNEELAQKMQYIKFALSTVFEPIAKFIVDVIYNIVAGLGAIIHAITGINIFAKATAKNFGKANKSAKGLKKTLAGFDEINILSDNSSGSAGGLANGIIPDISTKTTEFSEKIKNFFKDILHFIQFNFLDKLRYLFGPVGDLIYLPFLTGFTFIKTLIENLYKGIKSIVDGILLIFKGDFAGGVIKIFDGIKTILLAPFKALIETIKTVWTQIKDTISYWWQQIKIIFKEIGNTLKEPFESLVNIIENLWNIISTPIKNLVNKIKKALGFKVEIDFSSTGGGKNSYSGGGSAGGRAKGGIYYPKLAMGGIINQPGHGVPYHGATIGERGAEAVVPLTDSQQMELLGQAIGKYITINATIPVYAYNRQVDRQIQKIQNQQDMARNR